MKRFHLSIATHDYDASLRDYTLRLGALPCVTVPGRYALWRTELLNFSISCKPGQAGGQVRHLGFEDSDAIGFSETTDVNGIAWEHFSEQAQLEEISAKFPDVPAPAFKPSSTKASAPPLSYRLLSVADAGALRTLRLRALKEEPASFLEAYEELADKPASYFEKYFEKGWIAGAFLNGALVACSGLYRHRGARIAHKGTVWGVYTAPEARGLGCARQLIAMVLAEAEKAGLELIQISTDASNPVTNRLYQQLGFTPYGLEKHVLKLPDRYVDDVWMVKFLKPEAT